MSVQKINFLGLEDGWEGSVRFAVPGTPFLDVCWFDGIFYIIAKYSL